MSDLHEFIIKNVRCFEGEQRADIRPVTLLVGENSTGKTSFLGSYRALHQIIESDIFLRRGLIRQGNPDFNLEPFQMGAFRDIVRSKRGVPGGVGDFALGFGGVKKRDKEYDVLLTFIEEGSEPTVSSLCFKFPSGSDLNIRNLSSGKGVVEIPNRTIELTKNFHIFFVLSVLDQTIMRGDLELLEHMLKISNDDAEILSKFIKNEFGKKDVRKHARYGRLGLYPELKQQKSIAPLRSKPRRTYDPITELPTSEGEHVPMLMMRLLRTKDKKWDTLHDDLVEFGRQSGLFSEIKIKSHGKQINDPFQLQVKVRTGPHSNIMDVGYGINQILPILVEVIHSGPTTFLLQQPEVHLHPRGQAELSTFLAKSTREKKHSFLIETHSDYIIDRVRISVRDKILKPKDVSILYFDPGKTGSAVTIHNIKMDKQGNLVNAPPSYRDFFMKETDKLLGFDENG